MANVLPTFMIVVAAGFLVCVLYAAWQSVRALLVDAMRAPERSARAAEREALLREKEALLRAIREAEMDRDVGKLSERDFERLNARLRARAREVLGTLDAHLSPHRERARSLLDGTARSSEPIAHDGSDA